VEWTLSDDSELVEQLRIKSTSTDYEQHDTTRLCFEVLLPTQLAVQNYYLWFLCLGRGGGLNLGGIFDARFNTNNNNEIKITIINY
jgi:hypothetical protein